MPAAKRPHALRLVLPLICLFGLGACQTLPQGGAYQSIYVDTTPQVSADCTVSNDRGRWQVSQTPGALTVTRSTEPLALRCESRDGSLVGAGTVAPRLEPPGLFNRAAVDADSGLVPRYPGNLRVVMTETDPAPALRAQAQTRFQQSQTSFMPLSPGFVSRYRQPGGRYFAGTSLRPAVARPAEDPTPAPEPVRQTLAAPEDPPAADIAPTPLTPEAQLPSLDISAIPPDPAPSLGMVEPPPEISAPELTPAVTSPYPDIDVMPRCRFATVVVPAERETCLRSGGVILD